MTKLTDVCDVYSGYALKNFNDSQNGFPVIKIGNILTDGNLSLKNCQYTDDIVNEKYYSKNDDIYIALSGATTGKIGHLKTCDKYIINQRVGIVRNKNSNIPIGYIKYFLLNKTEKILQDASGCAQPNISPKQIGQYDFPVISKNKMSDVVSTLDKLQSIITHLRTQLEKLDLLVKARFVEMFGDPIVNHQGWRTMALEDNATLLNGRAYKQDELLDSGKYPVLRVGNFFSNRGWYYSDLELDEDKYCDNGDLLYAWSASFGSQIWKGGKVIYHYHIWKVLVGNAYNKQFLCYLLEYATESLMNDTHGIAMMHLTKRGMEKTKFIVPPLELQTQFADFVKQVDQSKSILQQELDKTQTLFDSLMQEYFG